MVGRWQGTATGTFTGHQRSHATKGYPHSTYQQAVTGQDVGRVCVFGNYELNGAEHQIRTRHLLFLVPFYQAQPGMYLYCFVFCVWLIAPFSDQVMRNCHYCGP